MSLSVTLTLLPTLTLTTCEPTLNRALTGTLTAGLGFFDMSAMDAALEKDVTGLVAAAATYNLEAQKQIYAAQYASKYSRIL